MSQSTTADETHEQFREEVRAAFAPHHKSRQALDCPGVKPHSREPEESRHNDGEAIYQHFGMKPFGKHLRSAAKHEHAIAKYPQALAHLVAHVENWEKHLLTSDEPDLSQFPRTRQLVFEWLREKPDDRMRRLRTGGTDLLVHGGQGTTKTTFLHWLAMTVMQTNPEENVLWQASLDDTEWLTLAPWATMCLPEGVETTVEANPYGTQFERGAENVDLALEDVCREVLRYSDARDLMRQLADRRPGQFYAVYPDPRFRACRSMTNRSYTSIWEAKETTDATPVNHWWFALLEAVVHHPQYGDWTTIIGDEAQKWLHQRASSDDHDWWEKVQDWATLYGDARKNRVSAFLACHKWAEVHEMVRKKLSWGATMNGEKFPDECPVDGVNRSQTLGQAVVWQAPSRFNHIGYPDLKSEISVPADIHVRYPRFEEVRDEKA